MKKDDAQFKDIAGYSEFVRWGSEGKRLTAQESIAACCYKCMADFTLRFHVIHPECQAFMFCPLYPFSPYKEGEVRLMPYDHPSYEVDPEL